MNQTKTIRYLDLFFGNLSLSLQTIVFTWYIVLVRIYLFYLFYLENKLYKKYTVSHLRKTPLPIDWWLVYAKCQSKKTATCLSTHQYGSLSHKTSQITYNVTPQLTSSFHLKRTVITILINRSVIDISFLYDYERQTYIPTESLKR